MNLANRGKRAILAEWWEFDPGLQCNSQGNKAAGSSHGAERLTQERQACVSQEFQSNREKKEKERLKIELYWKKTTFSLLPNTACNLFQKHTCLSIHSFSICEILKFSLLLFNQQRKHFQLHISAYRSIGVFRNCNTSHIAFTGEVIC